MISKMLIQNKATEDDMIKIAFHRKGRGQIFFAEVSPAYMDRVREIACTRKNGTYGVRIYDGTDPKWHWIPIHPEEV